ncbi:MAG: hypothetical protein AAF446_03330, partial [Pseudomonadota bacterium]
MSIFPPNASTARSAAARNLWFFVISCATLFCFSANPGWTQTEATSKPVAIAIHGGAGTIERTNLSPEREQTIRKALESA